MWPRVVGREFLWEAGLLNINTIEKGGYHSRGRQKMRMPRVGMWALIYCQEATKCEAQPQPP